MQVSTEFSLKIKSKSHVRQAVLTGSCLWSFQFKGTSLTKLHSWTQRRAFRILLCSPKRIPLTGAPSAWPFPFSFPPHLYWPLYKFSFSLRGDCVNEPTIRRHHVFCLLLRDTVVYWTFQRLSSSWWPGQLSGSGTSSLSSVLLGTGEKWLEDAPLGLTLSALGTSSAGRFYPVSLPPV